VEFRGKSGDVSDGCRDGAEGTVPANDQKFEKNYFFAWHLIYLIYREELRDEKILNR